MPTPTYDLITSTTLSSATNQIEVTSIPGTYRDLVIIFDFIKAVAGTDSLNIVFNNDGSTNAYLGNIMESDGATIAGRAFTGTDAVITWNYNLVQDASRSLVILNLMDYAQTNKHKQFLARGNNPTNEVSSATVRYASTNAVTTIKFYTGGNSNLAVGSSVSIYGIIS